MQGVADDAQVRLKGARRTALFSVLAAAFLVVVKLVVGLATGSLGLLADAAHSGTDVAAALLTLFALRVTSRAPDLDHPYGHGKAEHLAALAEATLLVGASLLIAWHALGRLTGSAHAEVEAPLYALAVMVGVLAVDASRAIISYRASRRYRSQALMANAMHFSSDFAASFAVLIGLILVRSGVTGADGIVALFVAALVLAAAARLLRHNIDVLMDRAPAAAVAVVSGAAAGVEGVDRVIRARVREAGGSYHADVVVRVPRLMGLERVHDVADNVEEAVRSQLPRTDVVVHVEPEISDETLERRVHAAALRISGLHEVHNVAIRRERGGYAVSLHVKVEAEMPMSAARDLARRLEEEIRLELPDLRGVESHLEPLKEAVVPPEKTLPRGGLAAALDAAVSAACGGVPHAVRVADTDEGIMAIVRLSVPGDSSVEEAHSLASEVEVEIRKRIPSLAEVLVHFGETETEP